MHGTAGMPEDHWALDYQKILPDLGFDVCTVRLPNFALSDIQTATEYVVHAVRVIAGGVGQARRHGRLQPGRARAALGGEVLARRAGCGRRHRHARDAAPRHRSWATPRARADRATRRCGRCGRARTSSPRSTRSTRRRARSTTRASTASTTSSCSPRVPTPTAALDGRHHDQHPGRLPGPPRHARRRARRRRRLRGRDGRADAPRPRRSGARARRAARPLRADLPPGPHARRRRHRAGGRLRQRRRDVRAGPGRERGAAASAPTRSHRDPRAGRPAGIAGLRARTVELTGTSRAADRGSRPASTPRASRRPPATHPSFSSASSGGAQRPTRIGRSGAIARSRFAR